MWRCTLIRNWVFVVRAFFPLVHLALLKQSILLSVGGASCGGRLLLNIAKTLCDTFRYTEPTLWRCASLGGGVHGLKTR